MGLGLGLRLRGVERTLVVIPATTRDKDHDRIQKEEKIDGTWKEKS